MTIKDSIDRIRRELDNQLKELNREPDSVLLVAVTKTHGVDVVEAALKAGITDFGENKVQEAMRKVPMLSVPYRGFHFIGHLQTNKINQLLSLKPKLIHSVDSLHLEENLHLALGRTNRTQDILIQINSSQEDSKGGFGFDEAEEIVRHVSSYNTLRVKGLMTIGQLGEPELSRPLFARMRELFLELKGLPGVEMNHLSMGMSHDYLIAVQEGANLVRIGSAIFGDRNYGGGV